MRYIKRFLRFYFGYPLSSLFAVSILCVVYGSLQKNFPFVFIGFIGLVDYIGCLIVREKEERE